MRSVFCFFGAALLLLFAAVPAYATSVDDMPSMTLSCGDELIGQEDGETVWNKTTVCMLLSPVLVHRLSSRMTPQKEPLRLSSSGEVGT